MQDFNLEGQHDQKNCSWTTGWRTDWRVSPCEVSTEAVTSGYITKGVGQGKRKTKKYCGSQISKDMVINWMTVSEGEEGPSFPACGQNPSLSARVEREQWGRPRLKTGIPILKMLSQRQL